MLSDFDTLSKDLSKVKTEATKSKSLLDKTSNLALSLHSTQVTLGQELKGVTNTLQDLAQRHDQLQMRHDTSIREAGEFKISIEGSKIVTLAKNYDQLQEQYSKIVTEVGEVKSFAEELKKKSIPQSLDQL